MAAISSNCLYLDRQDAKGGASGRTYEAFEVDKETRRRDCRICLYSLGLAIVVITLALLYLGVFSLDWMVEGDWASTFRCTSYMCLAVLMVVFIYCIAKSSLASRNAPTPIDRWHQESKSEQKQCSFTDGSEY